MSRKADLEGNIRASYDLIREYEELLRLSADPKEQARCRHQVAQQQDLVRDYLRELALLGGPLPADIAPLAAVPAGEPGPAAAARPTTRSHPMDLDLERGLAQLKAHLPRAAAAQFSPLQVRLLENLQRERLYGSTETTRADREAIVDALNRLALDYLEVSFSDLCLGLAVEGRTPPARPRPGPSPQDEALPAAAGEKPRPRRKPAARPEVAHALLTRSVPTALCSRLDAPRFPLVTVTIDNTGRGCGDVKVRTTVQIEGYSDAAADLRAIARGRQERIVLLPTLRPAAVAALVDIQPATLHIAVQQVTPEEESLYEKAERIHLQARDTALLAIRAPDGSITDLTDYLAAWVTPRAPAVEQLLGEAARRYLQKQFLGYQGAFSAAQGAAVVREQARAIFIALKEITRLAYVSAPLSLGAEAEQITQRVRLPAESLAAGAANCVEGAVLFASLLAAAGIDPVLVIIPGHALVGWRVWRNADDSEVLDTTMLGGEFERAQEKALVLYNEAVQKGYFSRGIFDPGGFARQIDVAACRAKGIYPL